MPRNAGNAYKVQGGSARVKATYEAKGKKSVIPIVVIVL